MPIDEAIVVRVERLYGRNLAQLSSSMLCDIVLQLRSGPSDLFDVSVEAGNSLALARISEQTVGTIADSPRVRWNDVLGGVTPTSRLEGSGHRNRDTSGYRGGSVHPYDI